MFIKVSQLFKSLQQLKLCPELMQIQKNDVLHIFAFALNPCFCILQLQHLKFQNTFWNDSSNVFH